MTIEPLKQKVSVEELRKILAGSKAKMKWKPQGVVLHNTWLPNLAMVEDYLAGTNKHGKNSKLKKISEGQLIDNWWVSYKRMGWYSGPHLFIFPTGIWIASPLNDRGTHSPSFNRTRFGVEMIGEYDKELLPENIKNYTAEAIRALLDFIGVPVNATTLKFHGEDPRTSHKGCPGKNARDKSVWIKLIGGSHG
jgi:hypothetical protein